MSDDDGSQLAPLEYYEMKSSYGRLTGAALGSHAIDDGFVLIHAGVGCKDKVTHVLAHDWQRHGSLHWGWTEVDERSLILGSASRLGPYVRSWQRRMKSAVVFVVSGSFLEMASEDLRGEVQRIAESSPVPVLLLSAPSEGGDEFEGYATLCEAVVGCIDWSPAEQVGNQVSLLGYWFDRYEGDHLGNMVQIRHLLRGLGLGLGPVLLSGSPFAKLLEAGRSELLVTLPYLRPLGDRLAATWQGAAGAQLATDLPMGFAGTRRWLTAIGEAAAVRPGLAAGYADQREARAREPLTPMTSRWRGTRVAVFAEPPLAAGYCSMLVELGLVPVLVGLRGRSLGGRAELLAALDRDGVALPEEVEILEAPSLYAIRERSRVLLHRGELDGLLGSATELNVLDAIPPPPPRPSERGPFVLEIGYPCWHYHAVQQMPFFGYGGMVTLAQRLIDPPRLWDRRRGALRE